MDVDLEELLASPESELLDFKAKHHENAADLVHDVLCLANSRKAGNRYLVFGVSDSPRAVVGVPPDHRRSLADVAHLLREQAVNRMPGMKMLQVMHADKEVDVLCIEDRPDKPYIIERDHKNGKTLVRCGVVYTRSADSNTPKDRSATDLEIEFMFRQRLGLESSPSERFPIYLRDTRNWESSEDDQGQSFFYEPFPEFTIREIQNTLPDYEEPWHLVYPDSKATKCEYALKYHTTKIRSVWIVWCDGARFALPMPHVHVVRSAGPQPECPRCFFFVSTDTKNLVANIVNSTFGERDLTLRRTDLVTFPSDRDAVGEIERDWLSGKRQFTYFRWNSEKRCHQMLRGQGAIIDLPIYPTSH